MKIYNREENKPKKSWAIDLRHDGDEIILCAVDEKNGDWISSFIGIRKGGKIKLYKDAYFALETQGYDPDEHGNKFDENGAIIIE